MEGRRKLVGMFVGVAVGIPVGANVGWCVGCAVGCDVGSDVGDNVHIPNEKHPVSAFALALLQYDTTMSWHSNDAKLVKQISDVHGEPSPAP